MTLSNSLNEKDLAHHIHPFTDLAAHAKRGPIVIDRGDGPYVIDTEGRRYFEAVSGLWSAALGFSETRPADAAIAQFRKLPYYHSFTHKTHAPAIDLAAKLAELAPPHLNHVHFANSGSESVDTAIKLVWYANNARGKPKKKTFLSRKLGYHGATVAAGSLTGIPRIPADFDLPAIPVRHLTCPHFYREGLPGESEAEFVARLGREMEAVIAVEGADTIAAFIAEPQMGAGGVLPPPQGYWPMVQAICRKHDILIVLDEIITGFGRMGTMFGADYFGITPDIMILSKQLMSSYQPLGALLVSDALNDILVQQSIKIGSFAHSFTNTGHPVAATVALETIRIIESDSLVENARLRGEELQAGLREFADHPLVGEVRGEGFMAAVEFVADKAAKRRFDPVGKLGGFLFERAHEHGLILRAVGDAVVFCPPLITSSEQVAEVLKAFGRTVRDAESFVIEQGLK